MDIILVPILKLFLVVLSLYSWALVIYAVLSLLMGFNIVNPYSPFVRIVGEFLNQIVEPFAAPIRKRLPSMGGIDLSILIMFFVIFLLREMITMIILKL